MTAAGTRAVVLAALLAGGVVCALVLTSDHVDHKAVAAVFEPVVGWSFIGTGLYAWRTRPESRTGALMVAMGFAWMLSALNVSNSPLVYTFALVTGGLFGALFLHLGVGFPSGPPHAGAGPRPRDPRLLHLPAGFRPLAAVLRPGRAELRRLPDQPAARTPRRDAGGDRARHRRPAVRRAVRDRADPRRAALATQRPARAPPAHPGVHHRARGVPARHRGAGERGRARAVGRVRGGGTAAVRVS